MKVIIVENELYLAQSIASRLDEHNFDVEIYSSAKDAMKKNADIYLVSTNLPGQNIIPLVTKAKNKITIMMVNYINNDTVGEPLKHGAKDYIVKPFMIEELLRKISLHNEFKKLQIQNKFYHEFATSLLGDIKHKQKIDKIPSSVVIQTNQQRAADKLALDIAKNKNLPLVFISLESSDWKSRAKAYTDNCIAYITRLEKFCATKREELFEIIQYKRFIISCTSDEIESPFAQICIKAKTTLLNNDEILTIDEYMQQIIKNYQYELPDTELSKKLGVSRKSLWERRKKYGIHKQK